MTLPNAPPVITADHTTWYTAENFNTNYPWFHLRNSGNTAAAYTLSVSCTGNISSCSVASNPGTIAVGATANVTVNYHSGPGNNSTGAMTLSATSPYGETTSYALTIVPLSSAVSVAASGAAGASSAAFTVSDVGNSSPVTYNLTCGYTGVVTSCTAPSAVQVYSGSPQTVGVTFGTNGSLAGGSGTVTLTASYSDGVNSYTSQASSAVTVPDTRTYSAAVTPDSVDYYAEQRVSTNYGFTVKNNGNATATYSLSSVCTGGETGCAPRQTSVSLSAGTSSTVYVDFSTGDPNVSGIGTVSLTATGPSNSSRGVIRVIPLSPQPQVTALDGTPSVSTNGSGTYHFQVALTGNSSPSTYSLQVTGCTAPLSNCSAPGTVTVYAGTPQTVAVNFQTQGGSGTGQVTLRAFVPNTVHAYESSATGSVNVASRLAVSTAFMNDDQDMSLCAASCFAATASHSTVPYYTLDSPRNVTLMYHGDRAFPRPFVYADVSIPFAANSVQAYWLEVRRNGVDIPFVNGDTKLIFAGTSTPAVTYRLAGQMDMSSYGTGVDSVTVLVTAIYANGTSDVVPVRTQIMVVNTQAPLIAKGWAIAGLQRLSYAPEGRGVGYMIENGDGSATYFAGTGGTATDFSVLSLSGQVWTRAYLDGTKVLFDASGHMTAVIDRLGRQTQFQYNGWNLTAIIEPMRAAGSTSTPYISLAYGANGLSTITETGGAGNRTTSVSVDANKRLTRITDPDGKYDSYGYDGSGRLNTITDRRGNTTTYYYGPTWKLSQIISPSVPVDAGGGGTTAINPTTTLTAWQGVGVPLTTTSGSPAPLVRPGASMGCIISATADTTTLGVDRWGQVTQATDPIGHTTVIERNGRLPTVVHHSDGSVDSASYVNGLPTTLRGAGKSTVHIRYGVFAQPDSIWGGGSAAQRIFLNSSNGNVDSVRHAGPTPNVAHFTYDALGRLIISKDEAGHTTQYGFDPTLGSTNAVTAPNGTTSNISLDAHGRIGNSTNGVDTPVVFSYDSLNRQVSVRRQGINTPAATTVYDGLLPTDVTDRNANTTHTAYNALGWATVRCDPTGRCMQYRYDASGRLTSETNRRGQRINMAYDRLGRLLTKSGDNTSADSFSYSADDRGVTARNSIETDTLRVRPGTSSLGAADTSITWINGVRYQVVHGDLGSWAGRDSTVITSTAPSVTFRKRYVYADTITGMINSFADGFNTTTYSYTGDWLETASSNATGNRNTIYLQTHAVRSTSFSASGLYDLARSYHDDRLVRIDQLFTYRAPAPTDEGHVYSYDTNGRLAQSTLRTGCSTVAGDGDGISHGSCTGYGVQAIYTYDSEGNRTSQGGSYTSGNRVVTLDGYSYEHDLDGNITRRYKLSSGEDNHYTWSSDNRLTDATVKLDASSSPGSFHYSYNAYGQLALRSINAALDRVWVHDRGQLLGEFDAAHGNQRVAEYMYGEGATEPYAVVVGATTPVSIDYTELDAAGNIIATHDGTSVTMTVSYDDWGNPSTGGISRVGNLFWKGLPRDEYTGLYYVEARWYDPSLGRFISEDPAGFAGGLNPYTFADDDPVNGSDPTGLFAGGGGILTGGCGLYCQFFSGVLHSPSKFPQHGAPNLNDVLHGANPGDAQGGPSFDQRFGWAGVASSAAEVGGEGVAVGSNFELYFRTASGGLFRGNQYVSVMSLSKIGRHGGTAFFFEGVVYDIFKVRNGDETAGKGFVNTGVGAGALWLGGPAGAILGATYFSVDQFAPSGWPGVLNGPRDCSYAIGKGILCP